MASNELLVMGPGSECHIFSFNTGTRINQSHSYRQILSRPGIIYSVVRKLVQRKHMLYRTHRLKIHHLVNGKFYYIFRLAMHNLIMLFERGIFLLTFENNDAAQISIPLQSSGRYCRNVQGIASRVIRGFFDFRFFCHTYSWANQICLFSFFLACVGFNVALVHVSGPHQKLGLEEDGQDLDQDVHPDIGRLRQGSYVTFIRLIEDKQH